MALAALTAGNWLPFMVVRQLGETYSYTILGGIVQLFHHNSQVSGALIFVFSFLFPFIKLFIILAAGGLLPGVSVARRRLFQAWARSVAHYSALDVFVVATMIVLTRFKDMALLREIVEVQPGSGLVWFCIAIVLSGVAGHLLVIPASSKGHPMPSSSQPGARRSNRLRNLLVAILGLALLAGGALVAFYLAPSEEDISLVRAVRVKDRLPIPMPWTQQYDLYLVLDTAGGQVRTHTEPNAILGNGLTFPLPQPLPFRSIQSITAWDARETGLFDKLRSRAQLDRIDEFGFEAQGSRFSFSLIPVRNMWKRWIPLIVGYTLIGAGVLLMSWLLVTAGQGPPPSSASDS